MLIHNYHYLPVGVDGGTILKAARHDGDVTNAASTDRHRVEFAADEDPGICVMHCYKVNHVMNGTFYPGETLTGVGYRTALDPDIFDQPMGNAGDSASGRAGSDPN